MKWRGIRSFHLVTREPARLVGFYEALGFAVGEAASIPADEMAVLGLGGSGTRRWLGYGPQRVALEWFTQGGAAYPAGAGAADPCFQHLALVTRDAAAAWGRAKAAGAVAISEGGVVRLPASSGGVAAVKFRDPEGHPLELLEFPGGDGQARIDHSAIVVRDRAASCGFYEMRGLVAGAVTHNRGVEQAALDGVSGADAMVVPLVPADGRPHLELLAYTPARAAVPVAVNDVAATRVAWWAEAGGLERDPDGHWHQLVAG